MRGTLAAGFSNIYTCYASVWNRNALNPHYGTVDATAPFVPYQHPGIHYFHAHHIPAATWLFAEATLYTECIHRHRAKHPFIAVIDPDEFLWLPPQSPQQTLVQLFASLLHEKSSSLVLADSMFPQSCQLPGSQGNASRLFVPSRSGTQPKSIVDPSGVLTYRVHTVAESAPGYRGGTPVSAAVAMFKHVRRSQNCDERTRSQLQDLHNATALAQYAPALSW